MHVTGRDHTNQGSAGTKCERDVQVSPCVRHSERVDTRFSTTVTSIQHDQATLAEEHLLGLRLGHAMLFVALAGVALIPIETADASPVDHDLYMPVIYTQR
jgi:hypothetical protein